MPGAFTETPTTSLSLPAIPPQREGGGGTSPVIANQESEGDVQDFEHLWEWSICICEITQTNEKGHSSFSLESPSSCCASTGSRVHGGHKSGRWFCVYDEDVK